MPKATRWVGPSLRNRLCRWIPAQWACRLFCPPRRSGGHEGLGCDAGPEPSMVHADHHRPSRTAGMGCRSARESADVSALVSLAHAIVQLLLHRQSTTMARIGVALSLALNLLLYGEHELGLSIEHGHFEGIGQIRFSIVDIIAQTSPCLVTSAVEPVPAPSSAKDRRGARVRRRPLANPDVVSSLPSSGPRHFSSGSRSLPALYSLSASQRGSSLAFLDGQRARLTPAQPR